MSINPVTAMDVDSPAGTLKRCSSAPMINENNSSMTSLSPGNSSARDQQSFSFGSNISTRTRRFSASFSPVPGSPVSGLRLTPRINQIRQDEHADISNSRELASERDLHNSMHISQSWEDFSIMHDSNDQKPSKIGLLHLNLPPHSPNCNSPSPTRLNCGFQSPTRATQRTFINRRSASPVLKPGLLGAKRKLEDDKVDYQMSPKAKRMHSYTPGDRGGLLTMASNSLPSSLSSVGTPESISSADSPGFAFRMVDSPSPNRVPPPEPMVLSKQDHDMAESPS